MANVDQTTDAPSRSVGAGPSEPADMQPPKPKAVPQPPPGGAGGEGQGGSGGGAAFGARNMGTGL
jgi:hypothetical protein